MIWPVVQFTIALRFLDSKKKKEKGKGQKKKERKKERREGGKKRQKRNKKRKEGERRRKKRKKRKEKRKKRKEKREAGLTAMDCSERLCFARNASGTKRQVWVFATDLKYTLTTKY